MVAEGAAKPPLLQSGDADTTKLDGRTGLVFSRIVLRGLGRSLARSMKSGGEAAIG